MSDWASAFTGALVGGANGLTAGPFGAIAGAVLGAAPGLASILFGADKEKAQGIAGRVAQAVQAATGAASADDAARVLKDNPQAYVTLQIELAKIAAQQADAERAAEKARIDGWIAETRAHLESTANARQQTVDLVRAGSSISWGVVAVSIAVLTVFGIVLWAVLSKALPPGQETLAQIMLGALVTMATGTVNYWVGTSASSARKTDIIGASVPAELMKGGKQ